MKTKDPAAVKLGRRGGRQTAKRGPEYYSRIAALRKNPGRKPAPKFSIA